MFLIPEDILENLICGKCKKYLSVRPIKVYANRSILCGRCSLEDQNGVTSIYDSLAEQCLYRCINRYEGCNKVLLYTDVSEHEKRCVSREFWCIRCPNVGTMGSLVLLNHFKENHKEYVLTSKQFSIPKVGKRLSRTYLYKTNNFLAMISIAVIHDLNNKPLIALNAIPLTGKYISLQIYQRYTVNILQDGKIKSTFVTKRKACSSYSNSLRNRRIITNLDIDPSFGLQVEFEIDFRNGLTLLSLPSFSDNTNPTPSCSYSKAIDTLNENIKLSMTNKFKTMWSSKYTLDAERKFILNLNRKIRLCSNCQNLFLTQSETQSIYKCLCTQCSMSNNLLCSKCYFFGIQLCINGNGKTYHFAAEETAVFKTVQYDCFFGCNEQFYSWELKTHMFTCPSEIYQSCPIKDCMIKLNYRDLIDHICKHSDVCLLENHLIKTQFFENQEKGCVVVPFLNYFITISFEKVLLHTFACSVFNAKNEYFGNLRPKACLKRGTIYMFENLFTVDLNIDKELLLILAENGEC